MVRGEGSFDKSGRNMIYFNGRKIYVYTLIAETALGKLLPEAAVIHHYAITPASTNC